MAAHAVGHHAQSLRRFEGPAVFIDRPDAALVGHTVRAQHRLSLSESQPLYRSSHEDATGSVHATAHVGGKWRRNAIQCATFFRCSRSTSRPKSPLKSRQTEWM